MTCLIPWEDRLRACLGGSELLDPILAAGSHSAVNPADRDLVVTYTESLGKQFWKARTGKRATDQAPRFELAYGPINPHTQALECLGMLGFLVHLNGVPLNAAEPETHTAWITSRLNIHGLSLDVPRYASALAPAAAGVLRRGYYRFWVTQVGPTYAYLHAAWPQLDETRVHSLKLAKWPDIRKILAKRAKKLVIRTLFVLSITAMQDEELWNLRPDQFYEDNGILYVHLDATPNFRKGRHHPIFVGAAIVKDYLAHLAKNHPTQKRLFEDPENPGHLLADLDHRIATLGNGIGPMSRERLRNTFVATLLNVNEDVDGWVLHLMGTPSLAHLDRVMTHLKLNPDVARELLMPVQWCASLDEHPCLKCGYVNRLGDLDCARCHRLLEFDALTPQGMAKAELIRVVSNLYDQARNPDDFARAALEEALP